jgi:hypothetical protein
MALRTSNDDLLAICNETGNYQFISTSAIIYSCRPSVHRWQLQAITGNNTLSIGLFAVLLAAIGL